MAEEKKTSTKAEKTANKKSDKAKSKKNPFKSIAKFFKSLKSECKKIVWPTAKEVLRNTGIVIVIVAIVGVVIYGIDQLLFHGMQGIKSLKDNTAISETAKTTTADTLESQTQAEAPAEPEQTEAAE